MSAVDFEDAASEPKRFTTVHDRYHIIGLLDGPGALTELAETAMRKADAIKIAKAYLEPKRFDRVQVYDSMAKGGGRIVFEAARATDAHPASETHANSLWRKRASP